MTLTRTILSVGLEYAWQRHRRRTLFGWRSSPHLWGVFESEFYEKSAAKDHFLTGVLSKPKLFVLGSDDELDEVTA